MYSIPDSDIIPSGDYTEKKINSLLAYAVQSRTANLRRSIDIAHVAKIESESLNYTKGKADSLYLLGLFHMIIGKSKESNLYSTEALSIYEEVGDQVGIANVMYTFGSVQYRESKFNRALEFLYKSLRLHRDAGEVAGESRSLWAIGVIYQSFQEDDKAMESFLECRKLSQLVQDIDGESTACTPLSSLYLKRGDIQNALETIETAIEYKQRIGDKIGLAYAYYEKGRILLKLKEYEDAEKYLLRAYKHHKRVEERLGEAFSLIKLGSLEFDRGDYELSKKYLLNGLAVAKIIKNREVKYKAFLMLYKNAKVEGDLETALAYHEKYHKNKSKVITSGVKSRVKSLEALWKMQRLEEETVAQKDIIEQTERKNQELDRFVSRVSHDLKGPLSSLIGLYDVVKVDVTDKKAMKYLGMYHKKIQSLNQTVLDLLSLSKVNALEVSYSKIDFERMISDVVDSFEYFPNYHEIMFQIKVVKLDFVSDARLVRTIIQNLIENSIKYSREKKPKVTIETKVDSENNVAIIVEDNGLGIDDKYQDKVYDMFYRATEQSSGSGLGMYITKNAVDRLEGEISFESKLGKGTCFTVILPNKESIS
ncbi:tetratricopeptide repeat-containing sensor histidine kinase [Reichenbachiella versicolor]|uniref:tetratricopeptide repeat-containing sensor histidine kinase n=1 Tax=Reichenbachiella versicolor TaxID=1821036 RepID=UPI000D6E9326|nr:tetratricopeptide repeat-containing sensor histidine kinase [Reichenbachiella versicolor]